MDILVSVITPIFGLVALGYSAAKLGWFDAQAERGLVQYVFNFAAPFMLFRSIGNAQLPADIPWGYFLSFYLSVATVYLLGMLLGRHMFGRDFGGQIITGFGYAFGNNVLLGLPLIMTALGSEAELPFFMLLSVHGLLLFTATTLLLEVNQSSRGRGIVDFARHIGAGLFLNPILVAIYIGLAINVSGIGIWSPLDRMSGLLAQSVPPCALFCLGAGLTRYGIAGHLTQSLLLIGAKLVLLPAMVFCLATFIFTVDPYWTMVAVLMAAQPSGAMVYVIADRYGTGQAIATTSIFLSTLASVLSLSLVMYLFGIQP